MIFSFIGCGGDSNLKKDDNTKTSEKNNKNTNKNADKNDENNKNNDYPLVMDYKTKPKALQTAIPPTAASQGFSKKLSVDPLTLPTTLPPHQH